jgi:hypothetical protein
MLDAQIKATAFLRMLSDLPMTWVRLFGEHELMSLPEIRRAATSDDDLCHLSVYTYAAAAIPSSLRGMARR